MNVANHLHLVPEIEREIVDRKLDSLVIGLGPTGHLVPWISRKVLNGLRLWGCHDVYRIMPVDDLFIFDAPKDRLHPGGEAFKLILEARPKRLWFFEGNYRTWEPHLHHPMRSVVRKVPMMVWQRGPRGNNMQRMPKRADLLADPVHTMWISPTGMTTTAWKEGCRRIGVIGVDCRKFEHHSYQWVKADLDPFFTHCAEQAHELGGVICNLSPISALENFRKWTPSAPPPSESSSAVTGTSTSTEQSSRSSIPSNDAPLGP